MIGWREGFVVFLATFLADICWAKYLLGISEKNPRKAANWSAVIMLLAAITVVAYTKNQTYVLYAMAGAWLGTYLTVWRSKV